MIVKHQAGADNAVNKQVYDVLRRNLMIGHFKPGQPISIRYLTETLGVSATPAREAIKRLQAEHALVVGSNRTPSVPVLTREDLRDLRDIRLALEGIATERAAEKINQSDLSHIRELCNHMADSIKNDDTDAYLKQNWEFHRAIYRVASSDYMMRMIENLWLRSGPQVRLTFFEQFSRSNSMMHHFRACEALESNDGVGARIAIEADIAGAASDIEKVLT